jgi:phosphoribosylamine-glycine ligase
LLTAGGRVLSVCGRGASLAEAISTAYEGVSKIHFEGMQYRSDICSDTIAKMEGTRSGAEVSGGGGGAS